MFADGSKLSEIALPCAEELAGVESRQVAGVHGGGSPIMETIGILSTYDFEERKKIARHLAGIPEEPPASL